MDPRIVIIGAGPAGLGAGYRLHQLGYTNFHIYERGDHIGGLASSFTDQAGFTWDIGGHVMFSHYPYYDQVFQDLMREEFQLNLRESWVRIMGTWVPYPFQNNIRYLPAEACYECLVGLLKAQQAGAAAAAVNYLQFMESVFGEGICKHFMKPYNFKVWAHPPELMSKQWIGERVAVVDVERALRNVVLQKDDFGWGPNNQFKFPLRGGTGEFYRRFAGPLDGHVTLHKEVRAISLADKQVQFKDGEVESYDILVSTVPADLLVAMVVDPLPQEVRRAAPLLKHSGGHMVGVGICQPCPSTKSWMYFPEGNCPFYRVTYLSNYSPFMTPDKSRCYSMLCETSYSPHKPAQSEEIVERTIQGLVDSGMIRQEDRKDIVSTWHYDAEYSYPVPTVERDEALSKIIPFFETRNVYSRGRFGMWKYEVSNTDHTLMQGVELVNRLLLGEEETTIGIEYSTDGKALTHRRAGVAGSGDPLKQALRPELAGKAS